MAVQRNKKDTLAIIVITAVDPGGTPTTASRSISNLNPALTDNEAYVLGTELGGFLKDETDSIRRTVRYDLAAE